MVPLASLWLPILVSSVVVFIASSIVHMCLKYHQSDFAKLPGEDEALEALGKLSIPPGDYTIPHAADMKQMSEPEFVEKMNRGPVAVITVLPNGPFQMGRCLLLWFVFSLVVGVFAAYVTGAALGPGAKYLEAFRFAGTTSFIAYSMAGWPRSIWYGQSWKTNVKTTFDGLVYGLLTGGVFGWLWPKQG